MQLVKLGKHRIAACNSSGCWRSRSRLHTSVMSCKQHADLAAQNDSQPADRSRSRKRKLDSSPSVSTPVSSLEVQGGAGMPAGAAPEDGPNNAAQNDDASPRGQPLQEFVEQWKFRWDMQRKAYPWEWASDSRLSDGPHNIIRCTTCELQLACVFGSAAICPTVMHPLCQDRQWAHFCPGQLDLSFLRLLRCRLSLNTGLVF